MFSDFVIEVFNVIEQSAFCNSSGFEGFKRINQLPFQGREKAFSDSVVITISFAAHALKNTMIFQDLPEIVTGILRAAIGMEDQSWGYLALCQCLF